MEKISGSLYVLETHVSHSQGAACTADVNLQPKRLGHLFRDGIKQMCRENGVIGLQISRSDVHKTCSESADTKLPRSNIAKSTLPSGHKFMNIVHGDVSGQMDIASKGGAQYFDTFIDNAWRQTTVQPVKTESENSRRFNGFLALAECQTGWTLKALHKDGGEEYFSTEFSNFLLMVLQSRMTCAYTPLQNENAERMNHTVLDLLRALMAHKNALKEFWADAVVTAAYLRKRVTCQGLPTYITTIQTSFGKTHDVKPI